MKRIAAMIGAGLIGRSWGIVFARAGWQVRLVDAGPAQLAAARERIAESLAEQQAAGLVTDAAAALARIALVERIEDAVADADWVQENLPEELDVKRTAFASLDRAAPLSAVLASSTSAIPASRFTENLTGRARCLVAHPVNPPHLVPVVELCGAPWTSPETLERARVVMTDVRQVPVTVRREVDGFILNRLQGALLSEAMRLVGEGYVSTEDLDKTIAHGLGLRWSFMGPFATIELNAPGGVADYCARYAGHLPQPRCQSAAARGVGRATTWHGWRPPRRRRRNANGEWHGAIGGSSRWRGTRQSRTSSQRNLEP